MQVCIDKHVLGTREHLQVSSDGQQACWISSMLDRAWHVCSHSASCPVCVDRCLNTVALLHGRKITLRPDDRFTLAARIVTSSSSVPWAQFMPKREHSSFVKSVVNSVVGAIDQITMNYLESTGEHCDVVLGSLERVWIDETRFRVALAGESCSSSKSILESFAPGPDGRASAVKYDRFSTATGRFVVKSGPGILNLRKKHRRVLRSRYGPSGAIASLDFGALESRIVFAQAGKRCGRGDLYEEIAAELLDKKPSSRERSTVKTAVLSLLYGAGRTSTAERLHEDVSESDVDVFVSAISQHFDFVGLGQRLLEEHRAHGLIRNTFGRPLLVDERNPQSNLLVSHFTQSTGVDVALAGFAKLIRALKKASALVHPLFVLHDALIVDVHRDLLSSLEHKSVKVDGFVDPFPLKLELIA